MSLQCFLSVFFLFLLTLTSNYAGEAEVKLEEPHLIVDIANVTDSTIFNDVDLPFTYSLNGWSMLFEHPNSTTIHP